MDNLSDFTKWINHRAYVPHPCIMLPPQSLDGFPELTNVENPLPFLWLIHSQNFALSGPSVQLSSVQSLSRVRLFATPRIAACQASLSITNSWSSLRLTSIESVMPSSHLILCRPLLLLPPIPPSIRVFSNKSTLLMKWPKTGVSEPFTQAFFCIFRKENLKKLQQLLHLADYSLLGLEVKS